MNLQSLRQQRNELADKMKALVPLNAESGTIDLNGEVTEEALSQYQALGRQVSALDATISVAESQEQVEANRAAVASIVAQRDGVSVDEATANIEAKREAWGAVVYDRLATSKHALPTRATEEQREIMNVNTGTDNQGGFAVPDEVVSGELLVELNHENVIRGLARTGTVQSGVQFALPIFDLEAYEGIAASKPRAKAESDTVAGAPPATPAAFNEARIEFQVSNVPAVPISREFLQDTTIANFTTEMLNGMAEMLGSWELGVMSAHANPTGAVKIRGYLADAGDAGQVAGAADTFTVTDLQRLYGRVRSRYRRNGTFVLGRGVIGTAIGFTIGTVPAWTPGFPDGRGGVGSPMLLGIPYVENDAMADHTAAANTPFISLGDMSRYRVYDVAGAMQLNTYDDSRFGQNYAIGVQVFNRTGARLATAQTGANAPVQFLKSK